VFSNVAMSSSSSNSKSRKLSVFDRLGPEEDLSHVSLLRYSMYFKKLSRDTKGSSSTTNRHTGYSGHKRDRQSKTKYV